MIRIEELRIGNYVLGPDSTGPERFTIDWFHAIEIKAITEEQLQPIPLTAEILEKCGFKDTSQKDRSSYYKILKGCYFKISKWRNNPFGNYIEVGTS